MTSTQFEAMMTELRAIHGVLATIDRRNAACVASADGQSADLPPGMIRNDKNADPLESMPVVLRDELPVSMAGDVARGKRRGKARQ